MFSCKVKSFVYYEHHENDYVMNHKHNYYECVYYANGKGLINYENDQKMYQGPCLSITSPDLYHDEKCLEDSNLYIVLFELKNSDINLKPHSLIKLNEEQNKRFLSLFKEMKEEEQNQRPYRNDYFDTLFSLILLSSLRLINVGKKEAYYEELVDKIKNFIKENYHQNIDFKQIASSCGYSYDRFRHIFKEITGYSINQYHLNCRLYMAKKFLIETDMTAKAIGEAVGFNSSVNFNDFFFKRMGLSPHKFRMSSKKLIDVGVFKIDEAITKPSIIIDTDLGGDCDDVGALAIANILHNSNQCAIKAITHTTSLVEGAKSCDIINRFYGNSFDIGQTTRNNFQIPTSNFAIKNVEKFGSNILIQDSISLLRKKLEDSENHSTIIVCIGQLNNMSELLDSKPDKISSLSGIELITKKVKKIVVMGGLFKDENETIMFDNKPYLVEYNIATDVESAQNFIEKCPVEVDFIDFKCGNEIITGKPFLDENNLNNPLTYSYVNFQKAYKPRQSWDLIAMYYAILGRDDFLSKSENGCIKILNDGTTIFDENTKKKHYVMRLIKSNDYITSKLNEIFIEGKKYEKNL